MNSKEIIVYISLDNKNIRVGTLWINNKNGKESAVFEYDKKWLTHPERFALEPMLSLNEGKFFTNENQKMFGAIGDSAPDRWGRILIKRNNILTSTIENKTPKSLFEKDYLLGISDELRLGAIRFTDKKNENIFLAPKDKNTIPPFIELPKLLSASKNIIKNKENLKDLKILLTPGSSLGGARPKASIKDKDGTLCIAKFPAKDNDYNVVLWEALALSLAKNAGINIPSFRVEKIANKNVLIIKRFDRSGTKRIPFLSAMSMLGANDNEDKHSYLEIKDALLQYGAHPEKDMEELWRRIVFTILISNTDDHLRNHGFLYERKKGWTLSPAYDLNPTPTYIKPRILKTYIDLDNNFASIDTALKISDEFRLSKEKTKKIIKEVYLSVKNWRKEALKLGIKKEECKKMESCFEHEDLEKAKNF